eukprot:3609830-Amphidinium_carterae.2
MEEQRENNLNVEIHALRGEALRAQKKESAMVEEVSHMRMELRDMRAWHEKELHESHLEINRLTVDMHRVSEEGRARKETGWRTARSDMPGPDSWPPGLPRSSTVAFMSADGVLTHRSVASGGAPPEPPPNPSGIGGIMMNGGNDPGVQLLCAGSGAPPPPPPPPNDNGTNQSLDHHGNDRRGGGSERRDELGYSGQRWDRSRRPGPSDPGGNDWSGMRGEFGVRYKRAEAATITLAAVPTPAHYRSWRINSLREIAAASLFPEKCYEWVLEAETDRYLNALGEFASIDGKLIAALNKILSGEMLRRVQTVIEEEGKRGEFTSGRGMLRVVLKHFRTNADHGQLYDVSDLAGETGW